MSNRKLIRPDLGDARKNEGPRAVRRKASRARRERVSAESRPPLVRSSSSTGAY